MPTSPDAVLTVVLAAALGLAGIPVGRATGRMVPLFVRHDPAPDDDSGPPPPTCPHCGTEIPFLRWLPLPRPVGFLWHGRCPACAATVPTSAATAWTTAAVFAAAGYTAGAGLGMAGSGWVALVALLFLGALGAVLSVIDVRVHRLPDVLVLRSYVVAAPLVLGGILTAPHLGGPGDLVGGVGPAAAAAPGVAGRRPDRHGRPGRLLLPALVHLPRRDGVG